jgi:LysR family glycine cleavage system transcriptional activator
MRIGSLPSTQLLIVFECAARHNNFTRASEELFITQAAVSHSIRQLESIPGFELFVRAKRRVTITEQGRDYLMDVRRILAELAETTYRIMALAGAPTINLAVVPTFSTYWLVPRLPDFLELHPEITINFRTRLVPFDIRGEGVDAAIHNGEPTWRGAVADYLMSEEMLPVCSSAFRRSHRLSFALAGVVFRYLVQNQFKGIVGQHQTETRIVDVAP